MKRALVALAAIGLGLLIVNGCANGGAPNLAPQIHVTKAEVRDWIDPQDGKTYLAIAPTWKNEGPEPVKEVFLAAELQGPKGKYVPQGASDGIRSPYLHYRGDPLDAGSVMSPSDDVESLIVLGPKEEVLAKTGENPVATVEAVWAWAEPTPEEPNRQDPP